MEAGWIQDHQSGYGSAEVMVMNMYEVEDSRTPGAWHGRLSFMYRAALKGSSQVMDISLDITDILI